MSSEDYNERVKALLQHYSPKSAAQADTLLGKYVGKEDKLLKGLVVQYGPEPSQTTNMQQQSSSSNQATNSSNNGAKSSSSSPSHVVDREDMKRRVKAMWEQYEPKKLFAAAPLLDRYFGEESKLLNLLVKKYGPEPSSSSSSTGNESESTTPPASQQKQQQHQQQRPPVSSAAQSKKQAATPSSAQRAQQQQQKPAATSSSSQSKQTTSSPSSSSEALKSRVVSFIRHYTPDKDPQALLAKYAGKEDALLNALIQKYGPEPSSSTSTPTTPQQQQQQQQQQPSSPPSSPTTASSSSNSAAVVEKIQRLVAQHDPEKQELIPQLLDQYNGREQDLLDALITQYESSPANENTSSSQQLPSLESLPMPERIRRLAKHYVPNTDQSQLDGLLSSYAGREQELLQALVSQYGPEPPII